MLKACAVCGVAFDCRGGAWKTCGPVCRKAYRRTYNRDYLRRTYGKRHRSKLKGTVRTCEVCGAGYEPRGWQQRTCRSPGCVAELKRRYESQPEVKAKRRKQAAAYYARPEVRAKHLEYNRTSPKARANAARYAAEGRSAAYQSRSRQRRNEQKAAADLAAIATALEKKL